MHRTPALSALTIALLLALSGCSNREAAMTEAAMLETARQQVARQDQRGALIQLRQAIQQHPQSASVRLALGQLLLSQGDPAGAAVELEKAQSLNAPADEVLPALAKAWLASGDAARVTSRLGSAQLPQPSAQAELWALVATAHLQNGEVDQGDALLQRARQLDPQAPGPLVLQARRQAAQGDVKSALASLAQARERHPEPAVLRQFEGELKLLGPRDLAGAEAAFKQALEARADHAPAHAGLVSLALLQQDRALAGQRLQAMTQAAPRHPQTLLTQGQVALIEGRYEQAQEAAQQLLRRSPDDVRVLLLAGEAALRGGSQVQGESLLTRVIQRAPDGLPARKLLAQSHLRSGDTAQALAVLQPVIDRRQADGAVHALAGQAHLKAGRTDAALTHFRQAKALSPDDTRIRTAHALAQIGRGQGQAVNELEAIASEDAGISADLALVSARLQQRQVDGALAAARAIARKQPDQALGAHLEGRILLQQGQTDAARAALERALKIDPQHFLSTMTLVGLDVADGRPQAATERLEALAQRQPRQPQALLALADHQARHGGSVGEIDATLQRAVKAAPESVPARLALVSRHLATGRHDEALKAAQEAVAALPQRGELLPVLAQAQMAVGDRQQAAATLRKLVAQEPDNPRALMLLAEVQRNLQERDAAQQSIRRALALQPDLLLGQQALISMALEDRDAAAAKAVVRQVQAQRPRESVGLMLEGDVAAHERAWDTATKAYRAALKLAPSTEGAIRLHRALSAAERRAELAAFEAEWARSHPRDVGFHLYLGDQAGARQSWAEAERHYARAVRVAPDQPLVLNNLAYAMAMQSKPAAVEPARRALSLLPDQPAVMDTMAWALAADRQLDKAVSLQQQAVARQGSSMPTLRLSLARLYLQAGDTAKAKQELQTLAALGDRFSEQTQVADLLKSI